MCCKSCLAAEEKVEELRNIQTSLNNEIKRLEDKNNLTEDMLCATLRWMEKCRIYDNFLNEYDQDEFNIRPEKIEKWFENRKKEDYFKKQEERENSILDIKKQISNQKQNLKVLQNRLEQLENSNSTSPPS